MPIFMLIIQVLVISVLHVVQKIENVYEGNNIEISWT